MRNVFAYDIFDRRTGDQIDERTLDEAILKHMNVDKPYVDTLDENMKIEYLEEAGFKVSPLDFIETLRHQSGHAGEELNPFEEHVQVDFNFPDGTVNFDLHMEEYEGKKYLVIQFFPKQGKFQSILKRLFDTDGNEKVFEACTYCGEEVIINAERHTKQPCPKCGELIKACCLCDSDDCANCR
jgi:predicted RNA-binding Zn-ribbon protein involved in translation (DUF1610 family)